MISNIYTSAFEHENSTKAKSMAKGEEEWDWSLKTISEKKRNLI